MREDEEAGGRGDERRPEDEETGGGGCGRRWMREDEETGGRGDGKRWKGGRIAHVSYPSRALVASLALLGHRSRSRPCRRPQLCLPLSSARPPSVVLIVLVTNNAFNG